MTDSADPTVPSAVGQVALLVRDVAATERFYADVLGLDHIDTWGDLVFFTCGGTRLFLRAVGDEWSAGSLVYFQVADIHAAAARLEAAGVTLTEPPHVIHTHDDGTQEWMTFFPDPAGNTLALMSQERP